MQNTNKISKLYEIALENEISVFEDCPEDIIAMAAKYPSGRKIVGLLNFSAIDSPFYYSDRKKRAYTKLECLAHEIGHCMEDAFYGANDSYVFRCKQEARAEKWAIQYVIPFDNLCQAVKEGNKELWELSEYFNVSENFVKQAIQYYEQHNKNVPEEIYKAD